MSKRLTNTMPDWLHPPGTLPPTDDERRLIVEQRVRDTDEEALKEQLDLIDDEKFEELEEELDEESFEELNEKLEQGR